MPKAGEGIGWLYHAYITIIKIQKIKIKKKIKYHTYDNIVNFKKNKILKIKNQITYIRYILMNINTYNLDKIRIDRKISITIYISIN